MVTIDNNSSKPSILCFGVQQGSVLSPVLFILYTKPLSNLIERHSISSQSFADDTQLLDSCHPDHLDTTVQRMQHCISEVKIQYVVKSHWLHNHLLQPAVMKEAHQLAVEACVGFPYFGVMDGQSQPGKFQSPPMRRYSPDPKFEAAPSRDSLNLSRLSSPCPGCLPLQR